MRALVASMLLAGSASCVHYSVDVHHGKAHVIVDGQLNGETDQSITSKVPVEVVLFKPGFDPVTVGPGSTTVDLSPVVVPAPSTIDTSARVDAWRLLRSALAMARAKDCIAALEIGDQLRTLDPFLHERVFSRELTLQPCLTPVAKPPGPPKPPETLDRGIILDAIDASYAQIMVCRDLAIKGTVVVALLVAPDGHVATVEIRSAPSPALGDCVSAVLAKARFAPTQKGGAFRHPFTF